MNIYGDLAYIYGDPLHVHLQAPFRQGVLHEICIISLVLSNPVVSRSRTKYENSSPGVLSFVLWLVDGLSNDTAILIVSLYSSNVMDEAKSFITAREMSA